MRGISPKLPLRRESPDGYALTKHHAEAMAQNMKHLILTNPGEKVMDPDFGCGIKRFLFETNDTNTYAHIAAVIMKSFRRYMPHVQIKDVEIRNATHVWTQSGKYDALPPNQLNEVGGNQINLRLLYSIPALSLTTVLSIGL